MQQAWLKASNSGANDGFGGIAVSHQVAISGDTIVVGAPYESSSATGVNGNQNNNSAQGAGAVYVFVREGSNWTQQAYLKASNTGAGDNFGSSVAISGDTIVVGAGGEGSNATGVNGDQGNNSAAWSGAAYVFVREGTNWTQQAWLKASNTAAEDNFGAYAVAISGDTIVVGAAGEDSNATGVNGDQSNNGAQFAGAAYVFVRQGTNWIQQAYLKASNPGADDWFGGSVTISGDTIVVGAPGEASSATGVNGNQNNNSAAWAGAAYVFVREGTNWVQQAYLKTSNTGANDGFGISVAISGDGIVAGAWWEDSNAQGVNGNQNNNTSMDAGAAYVFAREGTTWTQQAYLKASNTPASNTSGLDSEEFGIAVAISEDTIVVGAPREDSSALGVNGNQNNNLAPQSGAAYVFNVAGITAHEQWRALHFGSTVNSGTGADGADPDFDGLDNRLEFACGSHPLVPGPAPMSGTHTAAGVEFVYTRSKTSLTELQFAVEWSDSLTPGSWSSAGVSEAILSEGGTVQQVKATVPSGTGSRRFVRLRVTSVP